MKWKPIKAAVVVVLLLFTLIALVIWVPPRWRAHRLIQQAEPILASLESYRQQHGRYPESFSEAGIPEPEELYYTREQNGSYIVWFGTTLGDSVSFRSIDHKWHDY